MADQLMVVQQKSLDSKELGTITKNVDKLVSENMNNTVAVNQLAFLCSGVLACGDDFESNVSDKLRHSMLWGNIYERDRDLQIKLVGDKNAAQFVAQMILQKLAEKKLMSFDVITAINNRMNASVYKIDMEFKKVHDGMTSFLKQNKSDLARLESRLEKAERNINLLTWQSSIEYQQFDGVDYYELDDEAKIVCLVRDFYEITKGKWSTSDLLILKSAMGIIDLNYRDKVNFFDSINKISRREELKNKLLGGKHINPVADPSMLLSMTNFQKLESYAGPEHYLIESVGELLGENGVCLNEDNITSELTLKYFRKEVQVNMDIAVDVYDLCLDLLYNLKQAESMGVLVGEKALVEGQKPDLPYKNNEQEDVEQDEDINSHPVALPSPDKQPAADLVKKGDEYYEGKVRAQDYEQAFEYYQEAANQNNIQALYKLAEMYKTGKGRKVKAPGQARGCLIKAGQLGDAKGYFLAAEQYVEESNMDKAVEYYNKAIEMGSLEACHKLGAIGLGNSSVNNHRTNVALAEKAMLSAVKLGDNNAYAWLGSLWGDISSKPDYMKAIQYYQKGIQAKDGECAYLLGKMYYEGKGTRRNYDEAFKYFSLAEQLGYSDKALFETLATMYEKGQSVYIDKIKAKEYRDKCGLSFENIIKSLVLSNCSNKEISDGCKNLAKLANDGDFCANKLLSDPLYNNGNIRFNYILGVARILDRELSKGNKCNGLMINQAIGQYIRDSGIQGKVGLTWLGLGPK